MNLNLNIQIFTNFLKRSVLTFCNNVRVMMGRPTRRVNRTRQLMDVTPADAPTLEHLIAPSKFYHL